MTDDLEPLRRLRPDVLLPTDPGDGERLTAERRRLLADITGADADPAPMPSVYPRLAYRDERAALEYLVRVFGLVERREARMEHAGGMLSWLELDDGVNSSGVIMIGRAGAQRHGLASPTDVGAPTAMLMVYVADVDAHYRHAVAEGAVVLSELEDMFWGDRRYEAVDLEGHRWHFAQRLDKNSKTPRR